MQENVNPESVGRRLRELPGVDSVLRHMPGEAQARHGRASLTTAVRDALQDARREILSGGSPSVSEAEVARLAAARLQERGLRRVVNATGVILHTNLGRSVLSRRALESAVEAASGYSNLEYDLASGKRGSRYDHAVPLLTDLTGADDALVVNNCAAATLLALSAVVGEAGEGAAPEIIVSRGQLIEIGGGFRIPEVLEVSGARLREVGTTNRTRLADYERAINENTSAILWVHPSNFEVEGFTESAGVAELATLGPPVIADVGSGAVLPVADEPRVADSVRDGAALTIFSGDKLLGGPQAGIAVGQKGWIKAMRAHPLARAVRADKLCYAALEATLDAYLKDSAREEIPTQRMLHTSAEELAERARDLARRIQRASPALEAEVVASTARAGGGTLPVYEIPSRAVRISSSDPEALASSLREADTPVIGRVYGGALWLDVRTLLDGDEELIVAALENAVEETAGGETVGGEAVG